MKSAIDPAEAKRVTIESYDKHIDEYIAKDERDVRTLAYWPGVQFFLDSLERGAVIFEVGSGAGSDAQRIEGQGFRVQRSDVASQFLKRLGDRGFGTLRYDVLDAPTPQKYSAIFANAVLLHLTLDQFRIAARNLFLSLDQKGMLCVGMKLGDFEGWREKGLAGKRYFRFWDKAELENELTKVGFKILNTTVIDDGSFVVITLQKV
jgi:hypothetical protein